jgi:uncharacterized protein (UPF0332 family)
MSFDRFRAQTTCEGFFGCASFDDFFKLDFETLELDSPKSYAFSNALKEDASDLYFKGLLSLGESLQGFSNKNYSWAIVKGYYSVFYMLRADLALKDIGLVRHKIIYYLVAQSGKKPITKAKKGEHRSRYQSDHKATINYYIDLLKSTDTLLTQEIDGLNAYEWLMKKRERINYQERNFNEPGFPNFLEFINEEIEAGNFSKLVQEIIADPFVKTFQTEYAPLAIPIKRALLTMQGFANSGVPISIDNLRTNYINSILSGTIGELTV